MIECKSFVEDSVPLPRNIHGILLSISVSVSFWEIFMII